MKLRELKPKTMRALAATGDAEFKEWYERTQGRKFGTMEPITPDEIFRYGFSRGVTATLGFITDGQFSEEV